MQAATALDASYRLCDTFAQKSSFYSGFRLLPPRKHRALSAVYAFMRHCDDISDTEGAVERKTQEFAEWRGLFELAVRNGNGTHPILPALHDTIRNFGIPVDYFHKLIDGTQMDLTISRYETFQDLYQYCYHVASVVGIICIYIFEFQDPTAIERAEACGVAFQLTNILRDIKEDFLRGRIYIPAEDMRRFEYTPEDLGRQIRDERFTTLMKFEADRARSYYEKAEPLTALLARDSRAAFRAMFGSYRSILRHIEKRGFDVLSSRIRLRTDEKLGIMLRALLRL